MGIAAAFADFDVAGVMDGADASNFWRGGVYARVGVIRSGFTSAIHAFSVSLFRVDG